MLPSKRTCPWKQGGLEGNHTQVLRPRGHVETVGVQALKRHLSQLVFTTLFVLSMQLRLVLYIYLLLLLLLLLLRDLRVALLVAHAVVW